MYQIRRGYFARALGRTAIVAAVGVVLTTLCVSLSAPGVLTTVLVVLTTIALVAVAITAVSVLLPPALLQLDDHGFRAAKRFSSGPRQGEWHAVSGVASQQGPDGWVLMIQHVDGGLTAVPLRPIHADAVRVEEDVRERLNDAHGYRPLS